MNNSDKTDPHQLVNVEKKTLSRFSGEFRLPFPVKLLTHNINCQPSQITSLILSHNGQYIFTGTEDGSVVMWYTLTKQMIRSVQFSVGSINALVVSSDNRQLWAASGHTLCEWAIDQGEVVRHFDKMSDRIQQLVLSPKDELLFVAAGTEIVLWDTQNSTVLREFRGHTAVVTSLALIPNGRFASGSEDSTIRLWDVAKGKLIRVLDEHSEAVQALAVSPDGHYLFSGGRDGRIDRWDLLTGNLDYFSHSVENVIALTISQDGKYLFSSCKDSDLSNKQHNSTVSSREDVSLFMWEMGGRLIRQFKGVTKRIESLAANTNMVFSLNQEGVIQGWNIKTGWKKLWFGNEKSSVQAVSASTDKLSIISGNKLIKQWHLKSGKRLATTTVFAPKEWEKINSLAVTADGEHIFAGCSDGSIRVWTGELLGEGRILDKQRYTVDIITISSDQQYLFAAASEIYMWNIKQETLIQTFKKEHSRSIVALTVSQDGRYLFSGSYDHTIIMWDISTGRPHHTFSGHNYGVKAVLLSPNGQQLFTAGLDKSVRLWDVASGESVHSFEGHSGAILALAVSEDGDYLFSGSEDKTIRMWDVKNKTLVHTFEGHRHSVTSVVWNAEKKHLITGSLDGTVRFWCMKEKRLLGSLYDVAEGYLWNTPADEKATAGWFWTDNSQKITVYKAYENDPAPSVLTEDDEERKQYINDHNQNYMVMPQLNRSSDEYEKELVRLQQSAQRIKADRQQQESTVLLDWQQK